MVENVKVALENLDKEIININLEIDKLRFEKKKINGSIYIIKYTQNMMFIDELMDKIKKVDDQISYKIKYIYGDDLQECKRIINSLKCEYRDIVDEFDIDSELFADSKEAKSIDDLFNKFEDIMSNKKEYGEALREYDLEQRKKEWLENHDKLQEKHNKILNSFNKDNLINEVFETPVDCVNKDVDDEIPKKKVKMPRVRCGSCQDDVEFYGAEDNSDIDEDCKRCNDN